MIMHHHQYHLHHISSIVLDGPVVAEVVVVVVVVVVVGLFGKLVGVNDQRSLHPLPNTTQLSKPMPITITTISIPIHYYPTLLVRQIPP